MISVQAISLPGRNQELHLDSRDSSKDKRNLIISDGNYKQISSMKYETKVRHKMEM